MQISELSIQGLKGVYSNWRPGRLHLLCGPNGSGKTARLVALPLALHGYTPLGRTVEATASMGVNGDGLAVRCRLDDGFGWTRSIRKDPVKRSFSQDISVDGREQMKQAAAAAAVQEHVGDFTAALNLAEFTSLSPDRRRQFILGLCSAARKTTELLDRLEVALLNDLMGEGHVYTYCRATYQRDPADLTADERRAALKALWATVDRRIADAWAAMRQRAESCVTDDLIATVVAWGDAAKELKSRHKAEKEEALAAIGRLTESKNQLSVVADHVEQLRQKLAEEQQRLADVSRQIGVAEQAEATRDRAQRFLESADQRVARATADLLAAEQEAATDWESRRAPLLQRITDLKAAIGEGADGALERARQRLSDASAAERKARETIETCRRNHGLVTLRLQQDRSGLERRKADDWVRLAELAQKIGTATADDQKLLEELSAIIRRNAQAVEAEISELEFTVLDSERELQEIEQRGQAADAVLAKALDELAAADRDFVAADAASRRAAIATAQIEAVGKDLAVVDRDRNNAVARQELARQNLARLLKEQQEARAALEQSGDGASLEALRSERHAAQCAMQNLEQQIRQKDRLAALEQELTACIGRAEGERVAYELAVALEKAVKRIREDLLLDLVRPLLEKIDQFLVAAGLPVRSYCDLATDRGRAIFDLGWVVEQGGIERKTPLDSLSGGEAAMFGAALAFALATLSGAPIKILTIEADALDRQNLGRLLAGFAAVAEQLDHCVVATCQPIEGVDPPGGWTVERLGTNGAMA